MKARTHLRSGGRRTNGSSTNHNETLVHDTAPAARRSVFRVRTKLAAGGVGVKR
jgi:hypothetical protein